MAIIEDSMTTARLDVSQARARLADLRYETDDDAVSMIREDRDGR